MNEAQLRQSLVDVMRGWLGYSEANGKFQGIIDLYNTQRPLPRGYAVQYDDEWCATAVTAAGIAAGLHDIILPECSCSKMIALYQAQGRWMEDDGYVPQPGDIIMYDWEDDGQGDNIGAPNHVGVVSEVTGGTITVIEGNKGEEVASRTIAVNGRYIRGYCLPDYASKAQADEDPEYTQWVRHFERYRRELAAQAADPWAVPYIAQAIDAGLMADVGGTIERPRDFVTRQELATSLAAVGERIERGVK